MITLIVARDRNGAIGQNGEIPWDLPEDLRMFQRETLGGAIIMGRKTWDSLPMKPLAKRLNIVVSRDRHAAEHVTSSVADAISLALETGYHRIYGIGGAGIYQEMLPLADRLLITEVDVQVEAADAFFPMFDMGTWRRVKERALSSRDVRAVMREYLR